MTHDPAQQSLRFTRREFIRKGSMATALGVMGMGAASRLSATPNRGARFRFGMVADCQYADIGPRHTRFYRESLGKLREAVDTFNAMDLELVMDLGDLIDRDLDSFPDILAIYRDLRAPLHIVLGNHDFPGRNHARTLEVLGMEHSYKSFVVKGWRFVVLDGNDISRQAWPEESEPYQKAEAMIEDLTARGARNNVTYNGALGAEQLSWLHTTLDGSVAAGEPVLIFCHFPLRPDSVYNLWNDIELKGLLEACPNVAAFLNGHNHQGGYTSEGGVHYVTLHGMVETKDLNAFSHADVCDDRLVIKGYGRQPDHNLLFRPGVRELFKS